ncbi:MAG: hypothetical protein DIZ78_11340 [endosymbiont of Escarpia spicata]|uniref:Uncharacterized protein n=1 Tax=endosymbiont of Escarpia spicata TaxID=2200908 RepID=A0A370DKU3_9GAMM|nr:MAG: hypothetical protein DIZ78_11340 [endosymbiont of Escarpia spicata]
MLHSDKMMMPIPRTICDRSFQDQHRHSARLPTSAVTVALLIFWLVVFSPSSVAQTAEKTPGDVYHQVRLLTDAVRQLRRENNITTPWPYVDDAEAVRTPRHVFQKALEILGKISRYRANIAKTGAITVPRFHGRDITPNEVFSTVVRLRQELTLLLKHQMQEEQRLANKTSSHVYAALSEISIALEETLGLRSITPSEVYMRSLQVVELALFLRRSQGLPMEVAKPPRGQGKLPNHALKSVNDLLARIQHAERNLWMKPLTLTQQPRRVIAPSDVFDAMGVSMAELQRIQFRLGLERQFPDPEPQQGKTPDDVIQNARWAAALLPEFNLGRPLQQYDRSTLRKTPNQVFSVGEHILRKLMQYRRLRGIQTPPRKARMIPGLKSQHVYGKALEIMEKVDVLRQRQNLGPMAVPRYPLRTITPSEVFDLALRLDNELALIHRRGGGEAELWVTSTQVLEYENKQPSDVFHIMQRISNLLDTILGSEGFTPNDVYREVLVTKQDVQLIARALGETIPPETWRVPGFKSGTEPRDVLNKAREVVDLIAMAKRRAGMFGGRNIAVSTGETVTPSDVFNQVRLIDTELTEFKVFLDISDVPDRMQAQKNKVPAHVLQVLEGISAALRSLLHMEGGQA